ncbi:TetR/AcrR family transcriptional regulator [Brevundimonas sp.]|uniref:TetR/AcrR family transcriptional regulator n=1 Tax=Brevundimonas sp. TaxID=1871086 RepID=UPI0028AFA918|nr:TetR/AcrR family transcriptional regulator [Brevundimonas sp.]
MAVRGRPRSFDRALALQRIMDVFWAKGYEGAQVSDLTAAVGIAPPSFYAAFGSKEAAFREAVDLYVATTGSAAVRALDQGPTARDAMHAMLQSSIDTALAAPQSSGCLLVLGVVNCQPDTEPLRDLLIRIRADTEAAVRARLDRSVLEGDLSPSVDTRVLANYFSMLMQGLSMQARDGASRDALEALVAPSLAILTCDAPPLAKRRSPP